MKSNRFVITDFRYTRILLISVILLSVLPGLFFMFLSDIAQLLFILIFLSIFAFSSVITIYWIAKFLRLSLPPRNRNNNFTENEQYFPEVKEMANKVGYNKPIRITTNSLIKGPGFRDALIMLPSSWLIEYSHSEILAAIGHELGHLRGRGQFVKDLIIVIFAEILWIVTGFYSLIILQGGPKTPWLLIISLLAFAIVLLNYASWRNEYRADEYAANAVASKPLLTLLEAQKKKANKDEDSFTHPSFQRRINKLKRQIEGKRKKGYIT